MKKLTKKEFEKIDFEKYSITKNLNDFILIKNNEYFLITHEEFNQKFKDFGIPYFNICGYGNKCKNVINNLQKKNINCVFLYPKVPQFINNKFEIYGLIE